MCFKLVSVSRRQISTLIQAKPSIGSQIKTLVQDGLYLKALQLYSKNVAFCSPTTSKFLFPSLLKSCASLSDLRHGSAVHSNVFITGMHSDSFIATSLINMYVKCGSFCSAAKVFEKMPKRGNATQDVTLWNSMLDGYIRFGRIGDGLLHFNRMQVSGVRPDGYSLCILLGACCEGFPGFREGRQIHAYIVRNAFDRDPFLETALIDMYSRCGQALVACLVFEDLADKSNIAIWNALIGGLCENGLWRDSLVLFSLAKNEGCSLGSTTFCSALTACSSGEDEDVGRQVHSDVIKKGYQRDPYVCTSLLTMYANCGLLEFAQLVFYQTSHGGTELWNAMVSAYVGKGCIRKALNLYNQMRHNEVQIDSFTISNILSGCAVAGLYDVGTVVHTELIKRPVLSNVSVQSALLTMYSKCGSVEDANSVFVTMKERDLVAWGSMISGFCQNSKFKEALHLFREMEIEGIRPDSNIMASVIIASTGLKNIMLGCGVHGYVIKRGLVWDAFIASSLVEMYSGTGCVNRPGLIFSDMPYKNLVAWNSLISCYCRNGLPELSISLFSQIVQHGLHPDYFSITVVLAAVSLIATLSKGKIVHGYQIKLLLPCDIQVNNALIDMYMKCGSLKYAQNIFGQMPSRDLLTWNSMISGYGSHGDCLKAIGLFGNMMRSGLVPDDITFLSLITSCSHSGLVEEGLNFFQSMKVDHNIEPRMEHYVNVVDLLSRAGRVEDAYDFIQHMPVVPDRSIWLCLLCACRLHRNIELGELAAHKLLKVEPDSGSNYVPLLNLYGQTGSRDKEATLRLSMKGKGLKKNPGCSWIELGNRVVAFFSGDSSSPKATEVYDTLSSLIRNMEDKKRLPKCTPI